MPNHRTPLAKALLTGAAAKNPARFRDRSEPEAEPLGKPAACLTAPQKAAWNRFVGEWSWLTESDHAALVALCQLRAIIEDPTIDKSAALFTAYRLALSEFGGTPVSRSKVLQANGEHDDAFAFFDTALVGVRPSQPTTPRVRFPTPPPIPHRPHQAMTRTMRCHSSIVTITESV